MPSTLLAPLAALLYLAATGSQLFQISQRNLNVGRHVIALGLAALSLHAIVVWRALFEVDGSVHLGFFKISALIFLVINLACITSLLRRPLQNLLVVLFPLSALSVLVAYFAPETAAVATNMSGGMLVHVSSSILAYSVLTLAAIQAALLSLQDQQLRHRKTHGLVQILPPLQLME
ncbi:MAG: inner membrane protein YpjD, partial [Halioglobus sp.]